MDATFIIARPPGVNACYGNRRTGQAGRGRYVSPELSRWRRAAEKDFLAISPYKRFASAVTVQICVSESQMDNRTRDCDGIIKPVLDLLVSLGVIIDDCRKIVRKASAEWVDGPVGMITINVRETCEAKSMFHETKTKPTRDKAWAVRQIKKRLGVDIHPDRIHL